MPKDTFPKRFFSTRFTKTGRNRFIYFPLILLVVMLGLTSRKMSDQLPKLVNLFLGDALWALMIFLIAGFIFYRNSTKKIVLIAGIFCCMIEISQLYHAPWIDTIRSAKVGSLVFGFGFLWSDILAYSIGICFGWFTEKAFRIDAAILFSSLEDDHP